MSLFSIVVTEDGADLALRDFLEPLYMLARFVGLARTLKSTR